MNKEFFFNSYRYFLVGCCFLYLLLLHRPAKAQEHPPRPIIISVFQHMSFGSIIQGNSGGTVTINTDGSRSSSGDIYLTELWGSYYPAIFEVEANPGTLVSIVFGPDATLTGNNGGTMTLHIDSSEPPSPYINTLQPPGRTQINIGGTLTVGNPLATPAGDYSGLFSVVFIQE